MVEAAKILRLLVGLINNLRILRPCEAVQAKPVAAQVAPPSVDF